MLSRPIDFLGQATAASSDFQLTNSFEQRTFSDDWTLVKRFLEKLELTLHFILKTVITDITRCQNSPSIGWKMPPPEILLFWLFTRKISPHGVSKTLSRRYLNSTESPVPVVTQASTEWWESGKVIWLNVCINSFQMIAILAVLESMSGCVLFDSLRCTWREAMTKRRSHPRAPQRFRSPRGITRVTGRSAWSDSMKGCSDWSDCD